MKWRKSSSLLFNLVLSYMALLVLVIAALSISMIYFETVCEKKVGNGKRLQVQREEVLDEKGSLKDSLPEMSNRSGWVELLDEQLSVKEVKGNKLDATMQYTEEALENIMSREKNKYYASVLDFTDSQGARRYCLIKYERGVVYFNIQLNTSKKALEIEDERGQSIVGILVQAVILFLCLSIGIVILLGMWVNHKVQKPLELLKQGLEKMKEGDYKVRLGFKAISDFEIIRDSFNQMIEVLCQSIKDKEESEQSKKSMLLDLSHDIRTPVASIKGYASALNDGLVEEKDQKKRYYQTILQKTERISDLVEQLFELLKLENKAYQFQFLERDLCEVIRESILEYYDEIEEKHFNLEIDLPEKPQMVLMDERFLRRAIGNLILNALKYNETGTTIKVALENEGEYLKLRVSDNGLGIPEEIAPHVFEAFVRGDASRKSTGGTGLGLAITKMIIERHGGKIQYRALNKGSLFELDLSALKISSL